MRRALAVAMNHVEGRSAFGNVLAKQPLMMNVLADIGVEVIDVESRESIYMQYKKYMCTPRHNMTHLNRTFHSLDIYYYCYY
jgi:alkylation response protein AidB-like acyl-CoA dehydrogenase